MNSPDANRTAGVSGRTPALRLWRYTKTARVLHWTLALLLAAQLALGWYAVAIEKQSGADWYFATHKSIGLLIATLVVIRIFWRLTHPPQPLPADVPRWQARLALTTQMLLYGVMVLMPLAGYVGASYSKSGVALFGLALPRWTAPDHDLAERFFEWHGVLAWCLVALFALHLAGALKHLLVDKNGVFQRMWPTARS
ncbi:MAG: cytochrome b [Pseudomonadota bacterium]|nr:cytochrome b [Pseudomonadota bacterium]